MTDAGSMDYVYDDNGNMTDRGAQEITWDVENRPVTVTGGATFYYDGDGNRVKKVENNQTTVYVNKYYEKNVDTGVATSYYYLGGKLVVLNKGDEYGDYYVVVQDHLGGTSSTLYFGTDPMSTMTYEPFGDRRISQGTVPTDKLFTGQRLDGTGLYYYGARYYDPGIGRFISADTLVPDPKNPQALNRYSYVVNNPLKHVDPSGLDYAVVMGSGQRDEADWEVYLKYLSEQGLIAEGEKTVYLRDWWPDDLGTADIGPRVEQIVNWLNDPEVGLTDIKLIGFSEGAAAVGEFLNRLAEGTAGVSAYAASQIRAAVLLETPLGVPSNVAGFDPSHLINLEARLQNISVGAVYNKKSAIGNPMGPVEGLRMESFSWTPWWSFFSDMMGGMAQINATHGRVLVDPQALKISADMIPKRQGG